MVALVGTTVNPKCWLLTLLPHVVSLLLQLWIWRSFEVNLQPPATGIVAHGHDVSCQLLLLAKPSRFEMICPPTFQALSGRRCMSTSSPALSWSMGFCDATLDRLRGRGGAFCLALGVGFAFLAVRAAAGCLLGAIAVRTGLLQCDDTLCLQVCP